MVTGDVLDALRALPRGRRGVHLRVRETSALGDNELRMLRYLLLRRREGAVVRPSELSRHLGISSASATALLDRLEAGARRTRQSSHRPAQRISIAPTAHAETAFYADLSTPSRTVSPRSWAASTPTAATASSPSSARSRAAADNVAVEADALRAAPRPRRVDLAPSPRPDRHASIWSTASRIASRKPITVAR